MTGDENAVRTLLRESDIPATRLDVAGLMADSRRSRRRHRVAAAAGAVLAAVALAVPAVVVATRVTAPEPPAGDIATKTRVVLRKTQEARSAKCDLTSLPVLLPGAYGVQAVDATGEQVVAVNYSVSQLTLWSRGVPTLFAWPDLRAVRATVTAVNTGGTVVGYDSTDSTDSTAPAVSYLYRDGVVYTLAKPDGYHQALVVDVNERGDALGTLSPPGSPDDRRALVVWPAGRTDQPRVIAEAGLTPLALRDDGTIISLRTGERRLITVRGDVAVDRGDAVVVHRPDGTRLQIDAPPGFDHRGSLATGIVRGDLLFTTQATGEMIDYILENNERVSRPVSRPVRWNLRTGLVEVLDGAFVAGSLAAGSGGWLVAATEPAKAADVAVGPDGSARRLPADAGVSWISADGSTMIGYFMGGVVTWRCRR